MVLMQTCLEPTICWRYLSIGLRTFFHPNMRPPGIQSDLSKLIILKTFHREGKIIDGSIFDNFPSRVHKLMLIRFSMMGGLQFAAEPIWNLADTIG